MAKQSRSMRARGEARTAGKERTRERPRERGAGRGPKREAEGKQQRPAQSQPRQPGREAPLQPQPESGPRYRGSGRLAGKVGLVTGGDSGIGRAVALAFAREGADVAIIYLNEHADAQETCRLVSAEGRRCLKLAGDVGDEEFCRRAVEEVVRRLGKLDVLVNNAAEQHPQGSLEDISAQQLDRTFRTNLYGYFFMAKHALKHLSEGSAIINTASVTAYKGSSGLLDYSSTKGAIVAFTRSLSQSLAQRKIRVNAVAPGPIWTPLIAATFPPDKVATFGSDVPLGRAGQPDEVAPSYVFLACQDASYMTGQVLHPNGGTIVNG